MAQLPMTLIRPQALLIETRRPVTVKPPEGESYSATNTGNYYLGDVNVTGGALDDVRIYVACGCTEVTEERKAYTQFGVLDFLFLTNNDSITRITGNCQRVWYTTNQSTGEQTEHTGTDNFTCTPIKLKDIIKYVHASGLIKNEYDNAENNAIWSEYLLKEFNATKIFYVTMGNPYTGSGYLGGSTETYEHTFYMLTDDRFQEAYNIWKAANPTKPSKGTFTETSQIYVSQLEWYNNTLPYTTWTHVYALLGANYEKDMEFKFDVYLDGNNQPNIAVTYEKIKARGDWYQTATTMKMWLFPNANYTNPPSMTKKVLKEDGVEIEEPRDDIDYSYNQFVDYGDKFNTVIWASLDSDLFEGYNNIERLIIQPFARTTSFTLYLRIDYDDPITLKKKNTDLFKILIPVDLPASPDDITVAKIENSVYLLDEWLVNVYVHFGENPDIYDNPEDSDGKNDDGTDNPNKHGKYDKDDPTNTADFESGNGADTNSILTKTYAMSKERTQALGAKVWSQDYFDVLKIQDNPIENIISVKAFPFSMTGTEQSIQIGNVDMGVNALAVTKTTVKISIGTIKITEKYGSFLDYAPYTSIQLFLPYSGFVEMDTTQIMNTLLKVELVVDLITGACKYIIYADGICISEVDGNMGIDIPMTSTNRAQTDLAVLQNTVNGAMNAGVALLSKNPIGAIGSVVNTALDGAQASYSSSRSGNASSACSSYSQRNIFVIINRPNYSSVKSFGHTRGYVCNRTLKIGDLKGFTLVDNNIDLTSISATKNELDELRNLLASGVYV